MKNTFTKLEEALSRLEAGLARLEGWELSPPPGSRLRTYRDRLRTAMAAPDHIVSPELATKLQFDFREVGDFLDILESFPDGPTATEQLRLRVALGDDDHPDRGSSTKARDAQFELRLRAMFRRSGLGVAMEEPDLVLYSESLRIPVAAKRLQSATRFEDRLRSGISQLQQQPDEGIIALCLDQAIRPRGRWLVVPDKDLLAPTVEAHMKEFLRPRLQVITKRLSGKRAAGVLLALSIPSHSAAEDYIGSGDNWQFIPHREGGREPSAAANAVWAAVQSFT